MIEEDYLLKKKCGYTERVQKIELPKRPEMEINPDAIE
jgi:hypothetical protein